jgi:hypothetical protein
MALTDRLFDNMRVRLPGATDNALKLELYNVLDDFCREAFVWRETIDVPLTVGVTEYPITPVGTEIVRVYSIDHTSLDVSNVTFEFGTISFGTAPSAADVAAGSAFVVAALTPAITQGADPENLLPADMWSQWHRAIQAGVLSGMMAQSAKPYSNPQLAVFDHREYVSQKAYAKRHVDTGGQPGAQLWRFPQAGVR